MPTISGKFNFQNRKSLQNHLTIWTSQTHQTVLKWNKEKVKKLKKEKGGKRLRNLHKIYNLLGWGEGHMLTKCFNAVGKASGGHGSVLGCIRSTPPSPSVEWGRGPQVT